LNQIPHHQEFPKQLDWDIPVGRMDGSPEYRRTIKSSANDFFLECLKNPNIKQFKPLIDFLKPDVVCHMFWQHLNTPQELCEFGDFGPWYGSTSASCASTHSRSNRAGCLTLSSMLSSHVKTMKIALDVGNGDPITILRPFVPSECILPFNTQACQLFASG
jgi:hypothetical protein